MCQSYIDMNLSNHQNSTIRILFHQGKDNQYPVVQQTNNSSWLVSCYIHKLAKGLSSGRHLYFKLNILLNIFFNIFHVFNSWNSYKTRKARLPNYLETRGQLHWDLGSHLSSRNHLHDTLEQQHVYWIGNLVFHFSQVVKVVDNPSVRFYHLEMKEHDDSLKGHLLWLFCYWWTIR